MTIRELKAIASGLKIKGYSRMTKAALEAAIEAATAPQAEDIDGWDLIDVEYNHTVTVETNTTEDTTVFDYNEEGQQDLGGFTVDIQWEPMLMATARYLGGASGRVLTMAAYGWVWAAIWFAQMMVFHVWPAVKGWWVPAVKGVITEFAINFSYGLDVIKLGLLWVVMEQFGTSECLSGFQAHLRMVYVDTKESMYV